MGSSSHNQEKVSMVVMGCALVGAALGWLFVPVTKTVQDTADEATDAGHTAISFRSCMSDCTGENDSDDDTVDCFFDCAVFTVGLSLLIRHAPGAAIGAAAGTGVGLLLTNSCSSLFTGKSVLDFLLHLGWEGVKSTKGVVGPT